MLASTLPKQVLATLLSPLMWLDGQPGGRWRRFWAYARLRAQCPAVDPSVVVLGAPEMHGSGSLHLGRNLYLYRDIYFETREDGEIHIGDDVVLSRGVHVVSFSRVEIGAGSMIGEYSSLRDANHRFGDGMAPRHAGHEARPIRIGRNVWIGRGVTVLPGVHIGDGAVIGANSVVNRDVAAGAVVGGVPARPLRQKAA
jgi:acetyltransferase-like isoleucine patch superfamily enzyme